MDTSDDDYQYIYLDFNEKLTSNIFANKVFLRITNLHKPHPVVQINDLLFEGSYDECVGTNLFFEEAEDRPRRSNIFEKDTAIHLKPVVSQTKLIKLKQVKLPRQITSNPRVKESVVLNLNQEYKQLLEKLEQGALNIEDIAQTEPEQRVEEELEDLNFEAKDETTAEPESEIETLLSGAEDQSANARLEAKYERLRRLVRRPAKRMKSPELVEECEPQYKNSYEYHNLERQVCQNSDAFRSLSCPIIEKNFVGGVDIERCVLQGLIPPSSDLNRVLTKDEQEKIFTFDNFENLSLPARYLVLKEHISQIEELIENTSTEELKETDENGRTIADICEIFRRLVRALEQTMAQSEIEDDTSSKRTELSERKNEDYVKYRYDPSKELFMPSEEIFNIDQWVDRNEEKEKESRCAEEQEVGNDTSDSIDTDDLSGEQST